MNIHQIELFLEVAKAGSMSGAAALSSLAQADVSRKIGRLEDELGTRLFHRNGRGVVLTQEGEAFKRHAETVCSAIAVARAEIREMQMVPSGEVVIGLPPTVASFLSVPLVEAFQARFPNVSLAIVEGFSGFVLEWLEAGRLDVAVLYHSPSMSAHLGDELKTERLYLFGAAGSSSCPQPGAVVSGNDVVKLPLILPRRGHGLRSLLDSVFNLKGLEMPVYFEVDSLAVMQNMAMAGLGYTILPYAAMHDFVVDGRLSMWALREPEVSRRLVVASSRKRPGSAASRELTVIVRRLVGQLCDGPGRTRR